MRSRYHVIFAGRVQGVGFRFTARDIARDLDLTGWVKNLPDGSVEMLAEGEEEALVELIDKLKIFFKGNIRDVQVAKLFSTGTWTTFDITF